MLGNFYGLSGKNCKAVPSNLQPHHLIEQRYETSLSLAAVCPNHDMHKKRKPDDVVDGAIQSAR